MGAGAIPVHIEKEFLEKAKGKYNINVYTADMRYDGDDRIEVSAQGGHFIFAPPRQLLFDYRLGNTTQDQFQKAYYKFLSENYINHRHAWDSILDRKKIILVCSCNAKGKDCHRYLVVNFLKKLGGVYRGELKV